jgi:hypothetical protein
MTDPGAVPQRPNECVYTILPMVNTVCSGHLDPDRVPVMIPAEQAYYWTTERLATPGWGLSQ